MRGLEADVPRVLQEMRSAAADDRVCGLLCPYLEAWSSILEGAEKIERAILGALRRRLKIATDAGIESLQAMYPGDYMTWTLPGPSRDKQKIIAMHKNPNHRHIVPKGKEVFELGKSMFLKCGSLLPSAIQELNRCEDFVTHACPRE